MIGRFTLSRALRDQPQGCVSSNSGMRRPTCIHRERTISVFQHATNCSVSRRLTPRTTNRSRFTSNVPEGSRALCERSVSSSDVLQAHFSLLAWVLAQVLVSFWCVSVQRPSREVHHRRRCTRCLRRHHCRQRHLLPRRHHLGHGNLRTCRRDSLRGRHHHSRYIRRCHRYLGCRPQSHRHRGLQDPTRRRL